MANAGKIVLHIVFVLCLVLVLIGDYTGFLDRLSGVSGEEGQSRPPRPTNPGYGDSKTDIDLDADIEDDSIMNLETSSSSREAATRKIYLKIKNACLPKLVCELAATTSLPLAQREKTLIEALSQTTISNVAEVTSRYHFAAHMGQLISGVDGNGCHNFYPTCPFPGLQVLQMMKVRMR